MSGYCFVFGWVFVVVGFCCFFPFCFCVCDRLVTAQRGSEGCMAFISCLQRVVQIPQPPPPPPFPNKRTACTYQKLFIAAASLISHPEDSAVHVFDNYQQKTNRKKDPPPKKKKKEGRKRNGRRRRRNKKGNKEEEERKKERKKKQNNNSNKQ